MSFVAWLRRQTAQYKAAFYWALTWALTINPTAELKRVRAGQGITGDTQAIIAFFALLVIGIFVIGEIDSNLDTGSLDQNYSDSANETSGGFLDFTQIAVVLPVVVIGGLMLGILFRVMG